MKISNIVSLAASLALCGSAYSQLNVPVSSVSLEFPGAAAVTLKAGASVENVIPTPFLIAGQEAKSSAWMCMDPLQRIYYNGSGLPAGSSINYPSSNPADFDLWAPGAPGLSPQRMQDLADLFTAYFPIFNTQAGAGALQLAVWEITNEFDGNGYNLSTGQFMAYNNASLVTAAQGMLDSLSLASIHNQGYLGGVSLLIDGNISINGDYTLVQDLVGFNPPQLGFTPVPEPSTYGICGALGLGIVAALRRRRSKALAVAA
ncbi:MAG: PEP-CTERM sorting domain-containing protein [Opitutaceae bacterium]